MKIWNSDFRTTVGEKSKIFCNGLSSFPLLLFDFITELIEHEENSSRKAIMVTKTYNLITFILKMKNLKYIY